METVSGTTVPDDALSAAETARFTLVFTPSDHGAGWSVRVRKVSVNGVVAKSCTAALAWSAVMPPTSTVWMKTPGWIVGGGACAKAGAATINATTKKTAAAAPRTVARILLIEEAGVVGDRSVGSGRENAPQVFRGLEGPGEDRRTHRTAPCDDSRRDEPVVEHRRLRAGRGEHPSYPRRKSRAQDTEARADEALERRPLAEAVAVVGVGESCGKPWLDALRRPKDFRAEGGHDGSFDKAVCAHAVE